MSQFDEVIEILRSTHYSEKKQLLEYILRLAERAGRQFSQEDRQALLAYGYEEVANMLNDIPEAASYKEKDVIFECEEFLLGILLHMSGSPTQLPQEQLLKIKALTDLVGRERYIETTLDGIFEQPAITLQDVNRLLYWVRQTTDEYQKSKLFLGLVHYHKDLSKLDAGAKQALADYIASEMSRLVALEGEDAWNALELLADVSKYFPQENVLSALMQLVQLDRNPINFYVVESLCTLGQQVPQTVIDALAQDLEYANLTYCALRRAGREAQFPAQYTSEEYLAKSNLVHWLTFPTELGKAPDEIVYLGKIKQLFKKEVYHVFKYHSDSDTLGEDLKNKWLVGWSSNEGGTFSNFDEFAPFEKEPTEKMLKLIKKKLIG